MPGASRSRNLPDSIPAADRKRLHDAILAAVDNEVRPAYTKFADFIATDYAPKGRKDPGIWALPNGDQLYRLFIHLLTTTDKDPESIHQLGLSEVKRIEGEQLAIAKSLGFSDLVAFRASLKTNPKLIPQSREQILEKYRFYIAQMQPQLPKLFGLLPKAHLEVRPVEAFREKEAAGAEYSDGTPDGSRPGIVFVNTSDYQHRSLTSIESTAYHEGDPGHHMQGSIAQELSTLPPFRQEAGYGAYVEGWALYSERLGKEIGFYQDPYSDYGRLSDEMLRAVRLVLDTGVHYKHWTRQQMIDFFHEHTSNDEPDLQAETDRYIADSWPGSVLQTGTAGYFAIAQTRPGSAGQRNSTSARSTTKFWMAARSRSMCSTRGSLPGSPRKNRRPQARRPSSASRSRVKMRFECSAQLAAALHRRSSAVPPTRHATCAKTVLVFPTSELPQKPRFVNSQGIRPSARGTKLAPKCRRCAQGEHSMTGFSDSDLFRSILENLHMAVYVVGRDGKILFWNDGAERITGYLRQDVIGRVCSDNFLGEADGDESETDRPFRRSRSPCAMASRCRPKLPFATSPGIAFPCSCGRFRFATRMA